jgi:hypothetical protein
MVADFINAEYSTSTGKDSHRPLAVAGRLSSHMLAEKKDRILEII